LSSFLCGVRLLLRFRSFFSLSFSRRSYKVTHANISYIYNCIIV
uniref:Ovule protein n=1 Tax=Brugia timori TaxID=42155 RepID=A0A0R3Q3W2_9BILA